MKKDIISLFTALIFVGITSAAQAHMLWLNADNEAPQVGKTATVEIGFGHKYPSTEGVKEENIEKVFALDPKGRELPLERIAPGKFVFVPRSGGEYGIIAKMKKGFLCTTPDGRKLGSKKEIKDAVSCMQFAMNAKTMVRVGSKVKSSSHPADLPLEIIPLEDIGKLKVGKELSLRLLFNGKPVQGAKLKAVDADSAKQKEDAWTQETVSDEKGIVRIKLASRGQWLFAANHETPYPDPQECDKCSYRATLTLSVK
jgi:nickel transport protein